MENNFFKHTVLYVTLSLLSVSLITSSCWIHVNNSSMLLWSTGSTGDLTAARQTVKWKPFGGLCPTQAVFCLGFGNLFYSLVHCLWHIQPVRQPVILSFWLELSHKCRTETNNPSFLRPQRRLSPARCVSFWWLTHARHHIKVQRQSRFTAPVLVGLSEWSISAHLARCKTLKLCVHMDVLEQDSVSRQTHLGFKSLRICSCCEQWWKTFVSGVILFIINSFGTGV